MAGAGPFLIDRHQQHVAVAVVAHGRTYCRSPDVSPLHQNSRRLRLQNQVRPVSSVLANDSRFIHAIISTARSEASWTMAGTSPSALKATTSSSWSGKSMGTAV